MTDPPRQTRQPLIFWVTLALVLLGLGVAAYRVAILSPGSLVIVVAIILVLLALIVVVAAVWIRALLRAVSNAFPGAIHIPITVGADLAAASRHAAQALSDDRVRLRNNSYAALAFDAAGLHVASDLSGQYGFVPTDRVTIEGFGRTVVGAREMTSVRLLVTVGDDRITLEFVPMRLKGNPLRQLSPDEFVALADQLTRAMSGAPVEPGWRF
ncbi:hypothetical protein M2152_000220 [Microbacteriaceae bacterium SG_E_30_P1]|uniref:DUF1499 domain-containing protein n=1 Tax=Antiquaquibacter oligotrophicus TaxID=2880260 RepID=A0ABT6KKR2_9MICO|nr:hypothetical protein [Antiquaquibacter oligotrophicus]MDH6180038.1 hypothetical protein [Antiquaquibacter oligotrophicus]UDF14208.1 hypothetical protein LH407_04935 [Antiquaquibacter oligotrophicus]